MIDDFREMLEALLDADARFLVVGAYAMAFHGVPRATGALDLWIAHDPPNANRVWQALETFGAPLGDGGVVRADLEAQRTSIQIGVPPRCVDLLTDLTGLEFKEAWDHRVMQRLGSREVPFLCREDLVRNKRATHRTKDLADVEVLESAQH